MQPMIETDDFVLPRRLRDVQPTLIRRIFERALPNSINFGLGEPDLPTPQFMREEAARVTLEEQNGYTSHAGLPCFARENRGELPASEFRRESGLRHSRIAGSNDGGVSGDD